MAYAGALFADACLRGLNGDPDVVECTYIASNITEVPFFSSKVKLGRNGELQAMSTAAWLGWGAELNACMRPVMTAGHGQQCRAMSSISMGRCHPVSSKA